MLHRTARACDQTASPLTEEKCRKTNLNADADDALHAMRELNTRKLHDQLLP